MSTKAAPVAIWLGTVRSVVRRQLLALARYPANFAAALVSPFLSLAAALLLARAFGVDAFSVVADGPDLQSYLTLSAVFWTFVEGQLIMGFGLLSEMERGTLEALFLTPAARSAYLAGTAAFNLLRMLGNVVATLALARVTFGPIAIRRPWAALVLALLSLAVVYGYGLVLAGLTLLFRGDAFTYVWSSLLPLLTGRWFSPLVLPASLRCAAQLLPLTHSLDALRWAVADTPTMLPLAREVLYVSISAVALPMIGLALFRALELAVRRRGTLGQF